MMFANILIKPGYRIYSNFQKQQNRYFQGSMQPNNGGNNHDSILFIIIATAYILYNHRNRPNPPGNITL